MLESWWSENTDVRTGGEDRLLFPTDFTPTLDELVERRVFGQRVPAQITDVGPTNTGAYLDSHRDDADALEAAGGFLLGAFRVAWRPSEVVVITGFRDMAALTDAVDGAGTLAVSRHERGTVVRTGHTMVMLPARSSPVGSERVVGAAWTSG